jgi:8-oxo-dGTP diphosphatase
MHNKKHIVSITALIKNLAGDKFLIVKRSKDEIAFPGKWVFPGGKLETGQSVMDTLKREVLEEVGIDIEPRKQFITDYTFMRPDNHNVVGFTFLVHAISEDITLSADFDDHRWITPEQLKDFDYVPNMEKEISLAFPKKQ